VGLDAGAKGIESLVLRQEDQDRREDVAGVFVCAESLPNIDFLESRLAQGESAGLLVDAMLRTSAPGIFAAGAVRAGCPNFFVAAAADGTIAGLQAGGYCRAETA
jgi:thioredoxin reductase (NADPH)